MTRKELLKFIFEIESFINQLKKEDRIADKMAKSKRIKSWEELLIHIKDEIHSRDYHEFVMIHQDVQYRSNYFSGFDKLREDFVKACQSEDSIELVNFLDRNSNKTILDICRDFDIN